MIDCASWSAYFAVKMYPLSSNKHGQSTIPALAEVNWIAGFSADIISACYLHVTHMATSNQWCANSPDSLIVHAPSNITRPFLFILNYLERACHLSGEYLLGYFMYIATIGLPHILHVNPTYWYLKVMQSARESCSRGFGDFRLTLIYLISSNQFLSLRSGRPP